MKQQEVAKLFEIIRKNYGKQKFEKENKKINKPLYQTAADKSKFYIYHWSFFSLTTADCKRINIAFGLASDIIIFDLNTFCI